MLCQVALIGEANGKGDLCRAKRGSQKLPGSADAHLGKVVVRWKTNHVAEDPQKVKRADIHEAGKLFERNIFGVVIFQVFAHLLHPRLLPSYGLR